MLHTFFGVSARRRPPRPWPPRPRARARDRPVRAGRRAVERGPSRCAPPRWRASARAAGGWRDPSAETLSTLACAGSTVVVRGWCALIGWPALGTWLCATGWTPIAWSWIAPVLNGPLAGRHRPRWPWHLAPPVCSMPWWSYLLTPPSPPPHPCIAAARGDARLRAGKAGLGRDLAGPHARENTGNGVPLADAPETPVI